MLLCYVGYLLPFPLRYHLYFEMRDERYRYQRFLQFCLTRILFDVQWKCPQADSDLAVDCFPWKVFYWVFSFVFPWFYCQVKLCAQYFLVNVCPPQPLESSPHQKVRSVLTLPSVIENLVQNIIWRLIRNLYTILVVRIV